MPLTMFQALIALYITLNLAVFCTYWWDKGAARRGNRRISERTLLWFAFYGGSFGAIAAQRILRHKTRKEPFRTRLNAIALLHLALLLSLAIWCIGPWR
jgi:uncharacterized membrane protein YsdA (DUF1294 family)